VSRAISSEAIGRVLHLTGKQSRRVRDLPSDLVMRLVILLGILRDAASRQVLAALSPPGARLPGKGAISAARYRVGPRPLMALFAEIAKPWATPRTCGWAFYRGMRLVAVDATRLDVPDTPENVKVFGRPKTGRGQAGFPQAKVIALLEVGTHLILDMLIRPHHRHEWNAGIKLVRRSVVRGMLVMWDRGFYGFAMMRMVLEQGAQFLGRTKRNVILKPIKGLRDGSYLARVYASHADRRHDKGGITVRVIEYRVGEKGEVIRLVTSLLDPALDPAEKLAELYHQRWELELVFDEMKTHQLGRPNGQKVGIRAQKPSGVVQEIYALVLAHRVVRTLMAASALRVKVDPDRLSFKNALVIIRRHLPALCTVPSRGLPPLCPASSSRSDANASPRAKNAATNAA
jgi:hypothetical protein